MKHTHVILFTLLLLSCFKIFAQQNLQAESNLRQAELEAKEKLAAGTGLDPTEIIGRIEFNYKYTEKSNGTERHSGVFVLDKDINSSTTVGVELPLSTAKLANGDEQNGVGDVSFKLKKMAYKKGKFSTAFGGKLSLDTASERELGDGNNSVRMAMFNAYKHGEWLFAGITSLKLSEEEDDNAVSLIPLVAYQPMGEYLSYATVALPYSYRVRNGDSVTTAFFHLGKVMANKDVYSFGTKINISGPDDDDLVVLLGYRRLF